MNAEINQHDFNYTLSKTKLFLKFDVAKTAKLRKLRIQ